MSEGMDQAAALLLESLLNSLWQGLLVAVVVGILIRFGWSWNASTRYLVWWAALVAIALMPLAYRTPVLGPAPPEAAALTPLESASAKSSPAVRTDWLEPEESSSEKVVAFEEVSDSVNLPFVEGASVPRSGAEGTLRERMDSGAGAPGLQTLQTQGKGLRAKEAVLLRLPTGSWILAAAALWLLVSLVLLSRIGWSCAHLVRLRRSLRPLPQPLKDRLQELVVRSGVRGVSVGHWEGAVMPMAIALGRPAVVLPTRLLRELGSRELEQVVLHELAHIRRRDGWSHLIQKIVESFFFFHPVVHWIGRRLHLEREVACDDWVVSATGGRRAYAACLTRLVELRTGPARPLLAPGAASGRSLLFRRIEMLMDQNRVIRTRPARTALLTGLVGIAALLLALARMSPLVAFAGEAAPPSSEVTISSEGTSVPAPHPSRALSEDALPRDAPPSPASPPERDSGQDASQAPDPSPAVRKVEEDVFDLVEKALESLEEKLEGDLEILTERSLAEAWEGIFLAQGQTGQRAEAEEALRSLQEKLEGDLKALTEQALSREEVLLAQEGSRQKAAAARQRAREVELRTRELQEELKQRTQNFAQSKWGGEPLIPEEELVPFLVEIARSDPDPQVRQAALDGLSRFPGEAAAAALLRLYDEIDDVSLKRRILLQLTRSGSADPQILDRLERVARTETDPQLRRAAIQALGGKEAGVRILVSLYDGVSDAETRKAVMAALAASRSAQAAEKLKHIARSDPDPEMRREAVRHLAAGRFAVVAVAPPAAPAPPPAPSPAAAPPEPPPPEP